MTHINSIHVYGSVVTSMSAQSGTNKTRQEQDTRRRYAEKDSLDP